MPIDNSADHGEAQDSPDTPVPSLDTTDSAHTDSPAEHVGVLDDAEQAWVDSWYGNPPVGKPVIDPDTPEGAAIVSLFRRIKDVEEPDGNWPGGDVVQELTTWFTDLGIDPDEHPMDAGRRLRLELRDRPGGSLTTSVFGVRISTEHHKPEAFIRAGLTSLACQLGPGTSVDLVSFDRELLARIEQPAASPGAH